MKDRILQLLRDADSFATIEFALGNADPMAAVTALDELVRDLYWKQKDLAGALALGRAAAQHALLSAAAASDAPLAAELRGKAKAICYNIASFAWRGWGEEGIFVTAGDEAVGFDAARTNLRLAVELKKGDLALSRAHWMIGAHYLSRQENAAALASFRKALDFARLAAERGDEALNLGYCHLAELLCRADPENPEAVRPVTDSIEMLKSVGDGGFASQLTTAFRIFYVYPEEKREVG